ncbi:ets DNA-binding protein pokkuri-like isoform X2 [Lycorma delicatula]
MKLVPSRMLPPQSPGLPVFSSSDLLWRYPPLSLPTTPTYPSLDFRTQLPVALGNDPWQWSREDVVSFLRWCEFEFDLPQFDMDMFQMNGKALCLLTKSDLAERIPGSGDIVHNVLQMLMRYVGHRGGRSTLPSSPLTPHFPLTPSWAAAPPAIDFPNVTNHNSSVNLSPAPSVDSQSGSSPRHAATDSPSNFPGYNSYGSSQSNGGSTGSNQSDSDLEESVSPHSPNLGPTPPTQTPTSPPAHSPLPLPKLGQYFFPSEPTTEHNTNGRLLWDFLQQLLNDSQQRYTAYIAWKNREAGVFKIVDPPGLAKLWGIQKNHLSMNYDKMSRALRYYYRVNILRKVQGERHCYQFLRNPSELKSIKNISLLRQQMNNSSNSNNQSPVSSMPTAAPAQTSLTTSQTSVVDVKIKSEPYDNNNVDDDLRPTDLSVSRIIDNNNIDRNINNNNSNNNHTWSSASSSSTPPSSSTVNSHHNTSTQQHHIENNVWPPSVQSSRDEFTKPEDLRISSLNTTPTIKINDVSS